MWPYNFLENNLDGINSFDNVSYIYPWIKEDKTYSVGVLGLHEEINDFYEYSRLKIPEIRVRNLVFLKVKDVIHSKWPDAKVYLFGSFQTGLSLPYADLDIVVFNFVRRIPFFALEHKLVKEGITTFEDVRIISKATVPIIKFIHTQTGISVDLSFNCSDGPEAIKLINNYREQYQPLSKLLLVIKLFLNQRQLNSAYTGGLSSYSLTLMVVAFFKNHPRSNNLDESANLGVLLLEFLEFFGITFSHKILGIRLKNRDQFVKKHRLSFSDNGKKNQLCIEDPLDRLNNPSKNSHRYDEIRSAFRNAFHLLKNRCNGLNFNRIDTNFREYNKSMLSEIIGYKTDEIAVREGVLKFYHDEFELMTVKNEKRTVFDFSSEFIPFSRYIPEEPVSFED